MRVSPVVWFVAAIAAATIPAPAGQHGVVAAAVQRQAPNQSQANAAADKLAGDPRFKAALNAGRADAVKQMLVAAGAPSNLKVGVQTLGFNWSPASPAYDQNGGNGVICTEWVHDWYWAWFSPPLTAPVVVGNTLDGGWNFRWTCVGVKRVNQPPKKY